MAKQKQQEWQAEAEQFADRLEWQAAVARLMAIAESPVDAIAVAADLARAELHAAARRRARRHRKQEVATPAPVSKLLTEFSTSLRTKLLAVGQLMSPEELARLRGIVPSLVHSLDDHEADVIQVIGQLVAMEPDMIALWLRMNLDAIESRFAS